ncbi:MAG: hypothetical protein J6R31_02045, partial [Rikenellaceae bacterium]|nr:hypothetical protein [Rikenellaceae bacterium]
MKKIILTLSLVLCAATLVAQPTERKKDKRKKAKTEQTEQAAPTEMQPSAIVKLYPNGAPDSNGITREEGVYSWGVTHVTVPTLSIYPADPALATGQAVVVCPGGAYQFEAMNNEGDPVARWLARRG